MTGNRSALLIFFCCLALSIAGCGISGGEDGSAHSQEIADRGVAHVGIIETREEPFFSVQDSVFRGFEPSLAAELVSRVVAEVDVQFEAIGRDELPSLLRSGRLDMVFGATANELIMDEVVFSRSYYLDGIVLVTDSLEIDDADDLVGRTVARPSPTRADELFSAYLGATRDDVNLREYGPDRRSVDIFEEADADAVVTSWAAAQSWIVAQPDLRVLVLEFTDPIAVATDAEQPEFSVEINEALQGMIEDGTYDSLYRDWFGGERPWSDDLLLALAPIDSDWEIVENCEPDE